MDTSVAQVDEIQGKMREIRCEMRDDVQGLVDNARQMGDWRYYVRTYPWACLGVAVAAGYLIVPPKLHVIQPDPKALVELAKARQISVNADIQPKPSGGMANRLLNMAAGMMIQGGLAVLSGQLHRLLDRYAVGKTSAQGNGQAGGRHEEPHR
jgi:hypothetical protein